jgi:hypothetical protein
MEETTPLWRPRRKSNNNIKMNIKYDKRVWTGFIWLGTRTNDGLA